MYRTRIEKLQSILQHDEALLIESAPNRLYFTGFPSSAGVILVTAASATFIVDFRYVERARQVIDSCTVVEMKKLYDQIREIMAQEKIAALWIEADQVSVTQYKNYKTQFPMVEVHSENRMDHLITELRAVKTAQEVALIREAQRMTDETFTYVLDVIKEGRTERDVMLDMEFFMRRMGSEGVSFDFIVVSGKKSSMPHGVPSDKVIEKGDFVTMDFGAVYGGYHSDMTRTVAVGSVSEKQKHVYETVLEAQNRAFSMIRPGVICKEVDKAARDYIYSRGYEGCFGHGLGHSLGVEIHEMPAFNTRCETLTAPGMIITVEPGVYLEDQFGVRIEDMALITEEGYENLTHSRKDLIIL